MGIIPVCLQPIGSYTVRICDSWNESLDDFPKEHHDFSFRNADGYVSDEQAAIVVNTFLKRACFDCHHDDTAESDLNLNQIPWKLVDRNVRQRWVQIYDRIAAGEMHPDEKDLPNVDRAKLLEALGGSIRQVEREQTRKFGHGPLRCLAQTESRGSKTLSTSEQEKFQVETCREDGNVELWNGYFQLSAVNSAGTIFPSHEFYQRRLRSRLTVNIQVKRRFKQPVTSSVSAVHRAWSNRQRPSA